MKGYCLWKEIKKEIALLKKTNHPNIINLKEVIIEEKTDKVYFIMDYLKNGSLQPLEDLSEKSVAELKIKMLKILDAVYYLHKFAQIAHCDIKEENIMNCEENLIKIIDFGCAQFLNNGVMKKKFSGTTAY